MPPDRGQAVLSQRGRELVMAARAQHVVFARPRHLDGHAGGFGHEHRFRGVVADEPSPEAAAETRQWMLMASRSRPIRSAMRREQLEGICSGPVSSGLFHVRKKRASKPVRLASTGMATPCRRRHGATLPKISPGRDRVRCAWRATPARSWSSRGVPTRPRSGREGRAAGEQRRRSRLRGCRARRR